MICDQRICSYCYKPDKVLNCGVCKSRVYCSKDCQKLDWKQHKIWCGCGVAQLDVDFEVRESPLGGLGVFARRSFAVGERILVERTVLNLSPNPFLTTQGRDYFGNQFNAIFSESVKNAIVALYPVAAYNANDLIFESQIGPGALQYKYNSFDLDDNSLRSGLCVIASRFNHSCVPNCGRFFISDHELMTVYVTKPIKVDGELTISYACKGYESGDLQGFQAFMMQSWGFQCTCDVCKDPYLFQKLAQVHLNDRNIYTLGSTGKEAQAFELGEETIRLYDKLGMGPDLKVSRTYYDMFQMSVSRRSTIPKAIECARKALEISEVVMGGSKKEPKELTEAKKRVEHPEGHKLYCALSR